MSSETTKILQIYSHQPTRCFACADPHQIDRIAASVTPVSTTPHYLRNNACAFCDAPKTTRYDRLWCVLWGRVVCRVLSQSDASESIVGEKGIGESVRPTAPTKGRSGSPQFAGTSAIWHACLNRHFGTAAFPACALGAVSD